MSEPEVKLDVAAMRAGTIELAQYQPSTALRPTMRLAWRETAIYIPALDRFELELVQFWESPFYGQACEWRPVEVLP